MLQVASFLIVLTVRSAIIVRLRRECAALGRARNAWKDRAIAIETVFECQEEAEYVCKRSPSSTRKQRAAATAQLDNAETAAAQTTDALYKMGEWPDTEESALFRL